MVEYQLTLEALEEDTFKHRLVNYLAYFEKVKSDISMMRKPESVKNFFTFQDIFAYLENPNPSMLLSMGFTTVSDGTAYFITDDTTYGKNVLPQAFVRKTHPVHSAAKIFNDFVLEEKLILSADELVRYVSEFY